nr:metal ABC transporter permease [Arthrobacter sp. CAL618]
MGPVISGIPLPYPDAVVAAGAAVLGLLAGVVGVLAVLRQRTLVADALSHAALPGVAVAFLITGVTAASSLIVGAAVAGLIGAGAIVAVERTSRIRPDAAIGVVLSGFFSIGIVLLTYIAGTNNANQAGLQNYLFGQAAGLLEEDVTVFAVLAVTALGFTALMFRVLKTTLFDQAFAASLGLRVRAVEYLMTALLVVAVIVGIRTVGAILMVAMIVAPAAAARQFTTRLASMLLLAGLIGAAVAVTGALISTATQTPTGPVIVLTGLAVVLVSLALAPRRGILWRAHKLRRDRRDRQRTGLLAEIAAAERTGQTLTPASLAGDARTRRRALHDLENSRLLQQCDGQLHLTGAGHTAAQPILEREHLWTAWLKHGHQLDSPVVREPNPVDIRGSLGDDVADQLLALTRAEAS